MKLNVCLIHRFHIAFAKDDIYLVCLILGKIILRDIGLDFLSTAIVALTAKSKCLALLGIKM